MNTSTIIMLFVLAVTWSNSSLLCFLYVFGLWLLTGRIIICVTFLYTVSVVGVMAVVPAH